MYFDYLNTKSFMYVFSIPNLKQRTEYLLLLKCFAQFGKKSFQANCNNAKGHNFFVPIRVSDAILHK